MLPVGIRTKMVDEIENKLNRLQRYLPFIEFLLNLNNDKYKKFIDIRFWITSKKRYPIEVLEKVEQSLITQYKNLFLEDLDIPKYIMKIFNSHGEIKCFTVNLCSDDEDDGTKSDDSDDVKIVSVSFLPADTCKTREENICEPKNTKAINKFEEDTGTSIVTKATKLTQDVFAKDQMTKVNISEQIQFPESIIDEKAQTIKDNAHEQENSTKLNILKKRITAFNNNEKKGNEVSSTSVLNEDKLFKRRQDFDNNNDDEMRGLGNMDINSLNKIFNDLIENSGVDKTEIETCFRNSEGNDFRECGQPNKLNDLKRLEIDYCIPKKNSYGRLNDYSTKPFQKDIFIDSRQSMSYPQFYGLNRKDPRIIKQIEKLQHMMRNQPQLNRTTALNTTNFPVAPIMFNKGYQQVVVNHPVQQIERNKSCPATYKEHRMLKAKKELESADARSLPVKDQLEKLINPRYSHVKSQIKETADIGNSHFDDQTANMLNPHKSQLNDQVIKNNDKISTESQKPNLVNKQCNIKKFLMSELQPYGNMIADVLRKVQNNQHKNQCTFNKANDQRFEEKLKAPNNTDKLNIVSNETNLNNKYIDSEEVNNSIHQNEQIKLHIDRKKYEKNNMQNRKRCRSAKDSIIDPSSNLKRTRKLSTSSSSSSSSSASSFISSVPAQNKPSEDTPEIKKLKRLALESKPIVLLRRLTPSDIKKYVKPLIKCLPGESPKVLNVKLVEDVNKTRRNNHSSLEISAKWNTIKYKNTDSNMTSRNTTFCMLCKSKPSDLTNHYRRTHKTESYIARLSRTSLHSIENISFAQKITSGTRIHPKYKVKCVFCDIVLEDKFINFYKHYSVHTGEYAFQCSSCKLEKPFEVDIQSHQCHSKICRNGRLKYLYQYPPNVMVIYLHCCRICNFVQLNEANTFKHLRDHHDKRQEDSTFIRKYILTAINDGETTEYATSERDLNALHLTDDKITVTNEPISEDMVEYPNYEKSKNNKSEMITAESNLNTAENPTQDDQVTFVCTASTEIHDRQENFALFEQSHFVENIKSEYNESNILIKTSENESNILTKSSENNIVKSFVEKNSFLISKKKLDTPPKIYKTYPKDVQYFGLLKCMAADCWFSTDNKDEMKRHLVDHVNSEYPPEGYLQCAYCQLHAGECTTPDTLIEHVLNKHQRSRFQCSYCCYRGNSSSHVLLHLERAHGKEKGNIVFQCANYKITENEIEFKAAQHLLFENIEKLYCPLTGCTTKLYSLNWLKKHMSNDHGLEVDVAQFAQYACIYCSENFKDEDDIKYHLVLLHPDEMPYVCKRVLKTNNEDDSVKNLLLCEIELPYQGNESLRLVNVKIKMDTLTESINNIGKNLSEFQNITQPCTISELSQELKPNLEQLVAVNQDCVKQLLIKLTLNTGISPDKLYHCPYTICGGFFSTFELWQRHMHFRHQCVICECPHCINENKNNLHLEEFRKHFQMHCRHLYGCFHCGETFATEQIARDHVAASHTDIQKLRLEKLPLYFNHSFNVLVKDDHQMEQLDFLTNLQEVLRKRYEYIEKMNNDVKKTQWIVPLTESWLENFPCFTRNLNCKRKCFCTNCTFITYDYEVLFKHLKSAHQDEKNKFMCSKCDYRVQVNWDIIIDHIKIHLMNIYICCVCSFYHYDRQKLSSHINQEHRHRDVPVLYLIRSTECIHASIGVVFAEGRKTFSTTKTCFCCTDISFDRYAFHLQKIHNITLRYFCEICNQRITKLIESGQHFSDEHKLEALKIRAEFATNCQLSVISVTPLTINIDVHRYRDDFNSINPFIKQECQSDSDVVIIDDNDDIVIADDLLACGFEQNSTATTPKVKCVNLETLKPQVPEFIDTIMPQLFSPRLAFQSKDLNFSDSNNFTPITIDS